MGFIAAFFLMFDIGFHPIKSQSTLDEAKKIFSASIKYGLKNPPVRWLMLAAPFTTGISIYIFYALQPYLLQLYGDSKAYSIAGLVAAIVAGAQIAGGFAVPYIRKLFTKRTSILLTGIIMDTGILIAIGLTSNFWLVIALIIPWALIFAATIPVRQTFLNKLIPSQQRATVLSFDALMGSSGGVIFQPVLAKFEKKESDNIQ